MPTPQLDPAPKIKTINNKHSSELTTSILEEIKRAGWTKKDGERQALTTRVRMVRRLPTSLKVTAGGIPCNNN